jgi:hypothetical protein
MKDETWARKHNAMIDAFRAENAREAREVIEKQQARHAAEMAESPLARYLYLRKNGRFEIAGKDMTDEEVRDAFEEDFQVSIGTIRLRVRRDGMSPTDAVLMPRAKVKSMGAVARLSSGWAYWCKEYGIPTTETDLITRVDRDLYNFGPWAMRNKSVFCESGTKSGVKTLGYRLLTCHYDPQAVCVMWTEATMRAKELYGISCQVSKHSGHPSHGTRFLPVAPDYIQFDPRTKHYLPWGTVQGQNEEAKLDELLDGFAPLTAPHRVEYEWRKVRDMFALLGYVAATRARLRRQYILLTESEAFMEYDAKRMQEAMSKVFPQLLPKEG